MIITENELDQWVRGHAREAQGVIVELVYRLVAASSPKPKERRFPLDDSIGQHGPDGLLNVDLAFDPFVPEGRSFWEIGTGLDAGGKATDDYNGLVSGIPPSVRSESTFLFVTPLSARRDWEYTWKPDSQADWLETRRKKQEWKDVRVIDGTKLTDWVLQFPAVEMWLIGRMNGVQRLQIETPEQRWNLIRSYGEPPPLIEKVFLVNRDEACARINEVFAGAAVQLKLSTHFPDQVVDFVSAHLASLDEEKRLELAGRCLIITGTDGWNTAVAQKEKHILIADTTLDLAGDSGTKLIQMARRAGHAIIFGGALGGIPDPASVPLPAPRPHQLKEALEAAGHSEERARTLAQKSGGNMGSLLRCLQNISLMPEWADGSAAAELAIAAVLGSWMEKSEGDRSVVENISGKAYGEWIARMREIALRAGTPLIQRDTNWKFIARYEGWYALGRRLFDEDLDRLKTVAISVLRENDPKFDLPTGERYTASIHGKVLTHSELLRNGLAESLALLGSHPKALISCTAGKAETTAIITVREILGDSDWIRWASLDHLLPLLAEAAPEEFLARVEAELGREHCLFDEVFRQEGDAFLGGNYMSGLLWALETLAWDADLLSRVVICLGELAVRDPGGRWANRPHNSLTTILLPWLPQTCAPVAKRVGAVKMLLNELPSIGWKLLLTLLPQYHGSSSYTRRPAWRDTIPEDWPRTVLRTEYNEQVKLYSVLAVEIAKRDHKKLTELIDHLENIPATVNEHLLAYLGSDAALAMPEGERLGVWTELVDLVARHRKFSDAEWAMSPEQTDKIAAIAERLTPSAPFYRYQRLFTERDFDLYEEKGNYEEQSAELESRRQNALKEIAAIGGARAVLDFANVVQSPWRVGIAFAYIADEDADNLVIPSLLETRQKALAQFTSGFVWSRFRSGGWSWVDRINSSQWSPTQIAQFLSLLPFMEATWTRAATLLGDNESLYWGKTTANPYEADTGLNPALDKLIQYGRPYAAIRCIYMMVQRKQQFDKEQAARALLSALESKEPPHATDSHEIIEIIKALQNAPDTNADDLFQVEWAYLPLLDRLRDASPQLLSRRLATEPKVFCEVIRLVFRSKDEPEPVEQPTEEKRKIAANGYRLLKEWRIPPGMQVDGSFNGDEFKTWLDKVKTECAETGHLEIAMTMLGHALINAPADESGLWIQHSVAAALNARDAEDMRNGFSTELYNSRGVHYVDPTGKPERDLAEKYRAQAEAVEHAGYQRLAAILRTLAESYEREAENVSSSKERFDD
jgi:hypothetical protein